MRLIGCDRPIHFLGQLPGGCWIPRGRQHCGAGQRWAGARQTGGGGGGAGSKTLGETLWMKVESRSGQSAPPALSEDWTLGRSPDVRGEKAW